MTLLLTNDDLPTDLPEGAKSLLALVADKGTYLILVNLCRGPLRFNALRRCIGPVTPKALAQTLRRVERSGLISRQINPGSPPGVEYCGTPLGFSLAPMIRAIVRCSIKDYKAIERAQSEFDARATEEP